jgi:RNA polymerase sigma-70 factor (ECF subfamily)
MTSSNPPESSSDDPEPPKDPQPPKDPLAILDPDPIRAEAAFRELRTQLVRFLEWQKCQDPEDAAQEALARGFKRIAAGADTSVSGARSYFFGIAKNLVKEGWKSRKEELLDPADLERHPSTARHVEQVEARVALSECLGRLRDSERRLLVRYFTEDRIDLCRELGVTAGGLRVMVHRIRRKIDSLRKNGPTGGHRLASIV